MSAPFDARCVSDREEGDQAMLRQVLIILASVAAALSVANFGGGGGP
jgi:hypothetical protein